MKKQTRNFHIWNVWGNKHLLSVPCKGNNEQSPLHYRSLNKLCLWELHRGSEHWLAGRWWDMSSGLGSKTPGISCCFQFRDWLIFPKYSNVHRFKGVEQRAWRHSEGAWESCLLQDWKESWCLLRWRLNEISSWTYACLFLFAALPLCHRRQERGSVLAPACLFFYLNAYAPSGGNVST